MDDTALPLVDSHVHFWDPARLPYPWLVEVPAIAGAHTPSVLEAEAGKDMPTALVFVQSDCGSPAGEVAWIEALAAAEPRLAAMVAYAPMDRGAETRAALDDLRARPLVRGVRHLIQDEPEPGFCARPAFVAGVRRAGELGLSFDVCVRHHQLSAAAELAQRCPGTAFILDHAGKPDIRGGRLEPWREDLARLAALPNVACKLSGLVTEADPAGWTMGQLGRYADHALSCFGAERVMFGSDWPVVKLASSYRGWLGIARALVAGRSAPERRAVLADNARRIYRLA